MTTAFKRHPYRAAFAAIVAVLLVACSGPVAEMAAVAPAGNTAQSTLDAALQADRDFAAAVAKDGSKAGFLAWLHPTDSQFIQPGVYLKGASAIAAPFEQSPPGFAIAWVPDSGVGSASGDFASTTGRYTVKMEDQLLEQGRYMTSWRKDEAGVWKVVMDATIPDPATSDIPPTPDPQGRPG
jgi:ketosteroid isomerase-like protein